jgi:hypothetical protein
MGPVSLPVAGWLLDPLAPASPEHVPSLGPPTASAPVYLPGLDFFGSAGCCGDVTAGSSDPSNPNAPSYVFMLAPGSLNALSEFDAETLSLVRTLPLPFQVISDCHYRTDLSYYRGELYLLCDRGPKPVNPSLGINACNCRSDPWVYVLTVDGQVEHAFDLGSSMPPKSSYSKVAGGSGSNTVTGIDVAWGEIWVTGPMADAGTVSVDAFDAKTGAYKASTLLAVPDTPCTCTGGPLGVGNYRNYNEIAIAPEINGALLGHQLVKRGISPLDAFALPAVPNGGNTAVSTLGTDAVWGMHWLLEVGTDGYVNESQIVHNSLTSSLTGGLLDIGQYQLLPKRRWHPQQNDVSDPAYLNRDTRIDWIGPLAGWQDKWRDKWLRLDNQCTTYIVSDADIFLGNAYGRGERWYEPARGFVKADMYIDGQLKQTKTTNPDTFCIDTRDYSSGTHKIELRATVKDGAQEVTIANDKLRIDNAPPHGTLTDPGRYVRGTVTMQGTLADDHSGPESWQFEAVRPGGSSWETVCSGTTPDPVTNQTQCDWATNPWPEGTYQLRARLRDEALDNGAQIGNVDYTTPVRTTMVDNTPPALAHFAPALGQQGYELVSGVSTPIRWNQTDNLSGISNTTISYNSAPNGSCSGSWSTIGSSSATGDTSVDWDSIGVQPGLVCLQAVSTDNAGNPATYQWQAIVTPQRAPIGPAGSAAAPASYSYGYAGFQIANRGGTSWGTEGILIAPQFTPPGLVQQPDGSYQIQHTAVYANVGAPEANRSLQTGIINESRCPSQLPDSDPNKNRWRIYAELLDQIPGSPTYGSDWVGCVGVVPGGTTSPLYNYRTEVGAPGSGQAGAAAYWATYGGGGWSSDHPVTLESDPRSPNPPPNAIYDFYWMHPNPSGGGYSDSEVTGEVSNVGRRLDAMVMGAGYRGSPNAPGGSQTSAYTTPRWYADANGRESPDGTAAHITTPPDPNVPHTYDVTPWNAWWSSFCGFGPTSSYNQANGCFPGS